MSGYTPLFSSMLEGSLYGRWPYTGVWGCLLSFADAHGDIDRTPAMLAAAIGIPPKLLQKCLDDFMAPDTASRSTVLEGRRLTLIDPARSWGWHIVNIQKYRDMASGQNQIADGRNAAKLKRYRQRKKEKLTQTNTATPPDTARHRQTPATPPDTDSYSDSYSNSNSDRREEARAARSPAALLPGNFALTDGRRALAVLQRLDPERTFKKFTNHYRAATGAKARSHDWDAVWENWCLNEHDRGGGNGQHKTKFAKVVEQLHRG